MCVAPEFGESRGCDTASRNNERRFIAITLMPNVFRRRCGLQYFGFTGIDRIKIRARELVEQHGKAIDEVAKELRKGRTLSHEDVAAIMKAAQ